MSNTVNTAFRKIIILFFIFGIAISSTVAPTKMSQFQSTSNKESTEIGHCISSNLASKTSNPRILITGGAGYIGTHTIVVLLEAGYDVTVIDSLVNANEESLNRVRQISKCEVNRIKFYQADLCTMEEAEKAFKTDQFAACIHFAGLKAVGESVQKPLLYYENNLLSTINLLKLCDKYNCRSIVFSSSATVYGTAEVPITENTPTGLGITNAYGRTKYMIEEILKDFKRATLLDTTSTLPPWRIIILRYFNPVGSHPSGLIGEDPNGIPNNLMPFVAQVAVSRRPFLTVFGNDYDTPDGTGVRDYIHVMDLAEGHVSALQHMTRDNAGDQVVEVFNLGTGHGYSVLEMVAAMEEASGKPLPYQFGSRREGDIAVCYADASKSRDELHWVARRELNEMCRDLWNWQSTNPNGYNPL